MTLLGNIIVGLVVALIAFLSGRAFIRDLKRQLKGGGCSACGGNCNNVSLCSRPCTKVPTGVSGTGCSGTCNCGDNIKAAKPAGK